MTRRSLRPQLNQIRGWVRQGRTDAWIAHQLEVTVQQIEAFKREQDLDADGERARRAADEVDLRAEDDEAIAAELEAEAAARRGGGPRGRGGRARGRGGRGRPPRRGARPRSEAEAKPASGARRRGGRTRRRAPRGPLEGTFDHGEEGYGLWLDPAVQDDPVYAEHWAGHRPVRSRSRRTRS